MCPMSPLPNARVVCPWLLTGHLLLDLDHASFNHDLLMSHGSPQTGRGHMYKHQAKGVKKSYPERSI